MAQQIHDPDRVPEAITWLNTRAVANMIGQSVYSVRRLAEAGTWPSAYTPKAGGQWRIPAHEVAAWLEAMRPKVRRRPADGGD